MTKLTSRTNRSKLQSAHRRVPKKRALDAIARQISGVVIQNERNLQTMMRRENAAIGRKDRAGRNCIKQEVQTHEQEQGQQRRRGHVSESRVHKKRDNR